MISLEQIRLLEQKVEVAVSKIKQLNEENALLKKKCTDLEKEKEEVKSKLSIFEQDQVKIEQGIINALDRLNTVENSVLLAAGMLYPEQSAEEQDSQTVTNNSISKTIQQPPVSEENNSFQNIEKESPQEDFSLSYEEPSNESKPFDIF